MEPGQPWVRSRGTASACADRAWTKWIDCPSTRVVNCAELVQPRFPGAPVIGVVPVPDQLTQVGDRDAVLPAGSVDLVREAGPLQAGAQVPEDGVIHLDVELIDRLAHEVLPARPITSAP